jgi:hypothetical protein
MPYYCDLSLISLEQFRLQLLKGPLLPSQKILLEDMDNRLARLREKGISNLAELLKTLKTKKKVQTFAKESGLPENYLTVLRRQVNGYHPKARKLRDFTAIPESTRDKLETLGLKTTPQLFDRVVTKKERQKLARELDIPEDEMLMLTKLCDLCRMRYVNHTFATLLFHSGFDTVEKVKQANPEKLCEELKRVQASRQDLFKGNIGLKDMIFLVEDMANVSFEVEY